MRITSTPMIAHYVGVTGIQDPSQAEQLTQLGANYVIGSHYPHALMLGCLVSASTVLDKEPVNTSRPDRHVATLSKLKDILRTTHELGAIGMLHFELHKTWPGTRGDARDVISLLRAVSKNSTTPPVQLNGVLLPEEIIEIHTESGAPVVFQMRKELSSRGESEVLRYLEQVVGFVSMILMDPSAGSGEAINLKSALDLRAAIEARFPNTFTFGFAGGLGGSEPAQMARTTQLVEFLCKELTNANFSVDTETRVRVPGHNPTCDVLSVDLCERYFSAVTEGFARGVIR
jgi:hypothetical protein